MTYPGASAQTVVDTMVRPIQQEMSGLYWLEYISPTTQSSGAMEIDLTLKEGTDVNIGQLQVQDKLSLTDAEWLILSPFLPANATCGRKRAWSMREVINAICYVLRGGIAWRLLPDGFPPWSTVYRWFARLRHDGTWQTINHHLVMRDRERVGRDASPTAAVVDSQSVKTTESGGVRGYDAGKKIKGRKRHAMVDTDGGFLKLHVHGADIQDRDGAGPLLRASRPYWPFVQLVFADSVYQGPRVTAATSIRVEIVRKLEGVVSPGVV